MIQRIMRQSAVTCSRSKGVPAQFTSAFMQGMCCASLSIGVTTSCDSLEISLLPSTGITIKTFFANKINFPFRWPLDWPRFLTTVELERSPSAQFPISSHSKWSSDADDESGRCFLLLLVFDPINWLVDKLPHLYVCVGVCALIHENCEQQLCRLMLRSNALCKY